MGCASSKKEDVPASKVSNEGNIKFTGESYGDLRAQRYSERLQSFSEQGAKVVLLGDTCTGKTSIALRLTSGKFAENPEPTVGAAFMTHRVRLDEGSVKLEIWDTAGQERYRSLAPMYYRGASAAIIVYDITNKESFDVMQIWIDELYSRAEPSTVLAIAGNKIDLEDDRMVTREDVDEYLKELKKEKKIDPIFMECSAKTGAGLQELEMEICKKIMSPETEMN